MVHVIGSGCRRVEYRPWRTTENDPVDRDRPGQGVATRRRRSSRRAYQQNSAVLTGWRTTTRVSDASIDGVSTPTMRASVCRDVHDRADDHRTSTPVVTRAKTAVE